MQVLKYIEDSFESLSLRVKIELFLLPLLMVLFLIYILHENNDMQKFHTNVDVLEIDDIQMNESFVNILKNIESFAKENSIHLENISNSSTSIKIEANSNPKNRIVFLYFLENYNSFSKLKSLEIVDDKLLVEIIFNKFYKKDRVDLSDSLNFFEEEANLIYRLEAIVGEKVFINGSWFKVDDKIGALKVYEVNSKSVVLKNSYKTVVLRLYKNENI